MDTYKTDDGEKVVEFENENELYKYYDGVVLTGPFCPFCTGIDTIAIDAENSTCKHCGNFYLIRGGN